jgi:hypothetical protein
LPLDLAVAVVVLNGGSLGSEATGRPHGDRQVAGEAAIRVSERVNGDRVLENLALSACYGRDTTRSSGRKLPPTSSTRLRLWLFLVGLRSLHGIRRGVRSLECRNG